jgi:hypothetical protein
MNKKDYFRLFESKLKPVLTFKEGDIIHTIDYHYLEDEFGNDIDQNIMFVNPNVITGEYKVEKPSEIEGDYYCITLKDEYGNHGSTAYVGKEVIYENYLNSNMVKKP